MKKLFLVTLIVGIMMTGCATERVMSTGTQYPPTNPSSVKIYQSEKPSSAFEEIGRASVDKYNNLGISRSSEELKTKLKEQAASIGGNAIISISEDFASMSGVVVKFKSEAK